MTPQIDPKLIAQAHEAVAKYGGIAAAARALKIAESTLRRRLKYQRPGGTDAPKPSGKKYQGRSVDDFCERFDPTRKVQVAFITMPDWLYEIEFIEHAGIAQKDVPAIREAFADRIIEVRERGRTEKRIWCRTVGIAEKLAQKSNARRYIAGISS